MSDLPLLAGLREELIQLAARVVRANARVEVVGSQLRESSGSAWLFADRLWVTNYHVVDDARGKVTLTNGGQQIHGEVIGKDADTDLAVIRAIESIEVKPLLLRSGAAQLGELCFAIGAPLGDYADTMSMGIVSGLNRRLPQGDGRVLEDMLQTDTAINHGNSGGPLVDTDGCVQTTLALPFLFIRSRTLFPNSLKAAQLHALHLVPRSISESQEFPKVSIS